MKNPIKVFVSRAPALIPGMVETVSKSDRPLILVPESFTLAAEQALVQNTPHKGLIGTSVFSPTSLVREIRERAGFPDKKVITGDGRLIKSRFTNLGEDEMMDLENYARSHGVDRNKWQKPFKGDDKETERLENLRISLMDPLLELRKILSAKDCTGRAAAQAIYEYMN